MGAQGMAQTVRFNLQQKGDRKTIYDRKDTKRKGIYQELEDHRTLNSHSFALFQKEQFALRKEERKKRLLLRLTVVVVTIILISLFLYLWKHWDGSFLISSEYG